MILHCNSRLLVSHLIQFVVVNSSTVCSQECLFKCTAVFMNYKCHILLLFYTGHGDLFIKPRHSVRFTILYMVFWGLSSHFVSGWGGLGMEGGGLTSLHNLYIDGWGRYCICTLWVSLTSLYLFIFVVEIPDKC